MSRGKPVEEPGAVKPIEKLLWSEPGEFFPPDRGGIFQLSDISRELSFGFPFSFAGKEKGKGIYVIIGRTGRASLLPGRFPAV